MLVQARVEKAAAKVDARHICTHQAHQFVSAEAVLESRLFCKLCSRLAVDGVHEGSPEQDAGRVGAVEAVDVSRDGEDE